MSAQQDNFDKLSKDVNEANAECERIYSLWNAATERLDRLERLRNEAWRELVNRAAVT